MRQLHGNNEIMKVLFIAQGEGRGHLTQALTLEKMLRDHGHEVVEILVGKSKSREIPEFFLQRLKPLSISLRVPIFCLLKIINVSVYHVQSYTIY